jgi:hypothetical protein
VKCSTSRRDHQPFPTNAALPGRVNASLARLLPLAEEGSPGCVYAYVVSTVERYDDRFVQCGCGPNFQGGVITLCTCKHHMRAGRDADDWQGVWVAGLTGSREPFRQNWLVYLMRVERASLSHYDLWNALPPTVRWSKAAHRHVHGDVFQPVHGTARVHDPDLRFCPEGYVPPHPEHVHRKGNEWFKDVRLDFGRPAPLLVGDPARSFVWTRPAIYYAGGRHPRTRKWATLSAFLGELRCADGNSA